MIGGNFPGLCSRVRRRKRVIVTAPTLLQRLERMDRDIAIGIACVAASALSVVLIAWIAS